MIVNYFEGEGFSFTIDELSYPPQNQWNLGDVISVFGGVDEIDRDMEDYYIISDFVDIPEGVVAKIIYSHSLAIAAA